MIRRRLRKVLPAFAHFYGIRPWEVERLTFGEIAEFHRQLPRKADAVQQRRNPSARRH